MKRIRVLVVDDSVMARRLVSEIINSDPELEVAGIAQHGHIALSKIPQLAPDVVTLDVDMPEMNGLETLTRIRADYPHLPVIMLSGLTDDGAKLTIEALAMGASDYVAKPSGVGANSQTAEQVRAELIGKIKAHAQAAQPPAKERIPQAEANGPLAVVVIGISTGGPNALVKLLPALPADFPLPILIVQHMPPVFTKFLAERLNKLCSLNVFEAYHGARLEPGIVWIAPGDFHMEIERTAKGPVIQLNQGPMENSCRPSVDPTFHSAVDCFGSRVLGLIMTGMGRDGLRGSRAIHEAGGQLIAQDRESCVIWGMPRFVTEAGLPDEVLPLDSLAEAICQRVAVKRPPVQTRFSEAAA